MFRNKYLDYAELTKQLAAWQQAHPEFVRVTSLGKRAGTGSEHSVVRLQRADQSL